jgi:hypothetical protein
MLFYSVLSSLQLAIGMQEQQAGRLRLGLLLLAALAMVKLEGMILLGLWVVLLLLHSESRMAFWPLHRLGWAGWLGLVAWLPYVAFRLHGTVLSSESSWVSLLMTKPGAILPILPMTWVAIVSRRFLNNDFAAWGSPDNQHAVWQGHWLGWQSLVDPATQGVGWVCLLLLGVTWYWGGRMRGVVFRLFLVFLAFATVISVIQGTVHFGPKSYDMALTVSQMSAGGRYLYPVLMAWFVAGVILLLRHPHSAGFGGVKGRGDDTNLCTCEAETERVLRATPYEPQTRHSWHEGQADATLLTHFQHRQV